MRHDSRRRWLWVAAVALIVGAAGLGTRALTGADHLDAPATMADADADLNDVYVFRNPGDPTRVVFGMTMHPAITPAQASTAGFSSDVLYQWKIDTNGDATEDLVIQARVVDDGGTPTLVVRGPVAPTTTGAQTREADVEPSATGRVSAAGETFVIEGSNGVRAFAGVREDPFYIDLEQLKKVLAGEAMSFRNPGVDFLAGLNTLAIVVEVPRTSLGTSADIGVWGTSSK